MTLPTPSFRMRLPRPIRPPPLGLVLLEVLPPIDRGSGTSGIERSAGVVHLAARIGSPPVSPEYQRWRVLWPLVPAMAMVMIDFTIVSISVTTIQRDLHLSATAAQWTVTAYALATAAFIALG